MLLVIFFIDILILSFNIFLDLLGLIAPAAMAKEMLALLCATNAAVGTVHISSLYKNIKHAKKILEFIGELPDWINYNRNLEEHLNILRRKMECLEYVQADVICQLENTELQSGKKRKREVDHWLRSVKKKADDVNEVQTNINSVWYLPRFLFRAWLGSSIGEEIQEVSKLQEQGKFTEGLLLDAPRDGGEPFVTSQLVGQSLHEKIGTILSHINDPEILKIGVQGIEGIGKTAIMMEIHNRLLARSSCRVYYVNLAWNFSIYSIQAAIASSMKMNLLQTEGSEITRAARIFSVLKSLKEYVIILDGLSEFFDWAEVGIPVECNGGTLVLTCRSSDVCRRMLCHETVVLENLSREDSETLFMEKLIAGVPVSEEIREVAKHIVQKCNGVPSRIIDMGIQLRGVTDINEWRSTLNDMSTYGNK